MHFTFIRHAESVSNAAERWQGQTDSPLSDRGREQARALAERLASRTFDRVVASDLTRAAETARALGRPVDVDPTWREIHLGRWEGLTRSEVAERFPDELEALARGEDIDIGGGESWGAVATRGLAAFRELVESSAPNARVCVVSHGGILSEVVARAIGLERARPRSLGRLSNTSITEVVVHAGAEGAVTRYNDALHAEELAEWAAHRVARSDATVVDVEAIDGGLGDSSALADLVRARQARVRAAPLGLAALARSFLDPAARFLPPGAGSRAQILVGDEQRCTIVSYGAGSGPTVKKPEATSG